MANSYYVVQFWWLQDILGVFAVLYSSYQKLDRPPIDEEAPEGTPDPRELKPVVVVHDGGGDDAVIMPKKKKQPKKVETASMDSESSFVISFLPVVVPTLLPIHYFIFLFFSPNRRTFKCKFASPSGPCHE